VPSERCSIEEQSIEYLDGRVVSSEVVRKTGFRVNGRMGVVSWGVVGLGNCVTLLRTLLAW
jgi:hypothetical protein